MDTFALTEGEFGVTFCRPARSNDGLLESFVVRIVEPGLTAEAPVGNSPYIQGPEILFREMAESWRGWSGEKSWNALEGELALTATADSQGHITVRVQVRSGSCFDGWSLTSFAFLEAGQLEFFQKRASRFFGREP